MFIQILSIVISPSGAAIITCITVLTILMLIRGKIFSKDSGIKLSFAGASLESNPYTSLESPKELAVQAKSTAGVDPGPETDEKQEVEKETIPLLVDAIIKNEPLKVKELVAKAKNEGEVLILGQPVSIAELYWPARAGDEDSLEKLRNFSGPTELKAASDKLVFNILLAEEKFSDASKQLTKMEAAWQKNFVILRANLLEKTDSMSAALTYLLSQEESVETGIRFDYYAEAARLSKMLGKNREYHYLSEIALSINPSASGLRFDLARSYASSDDQNSQLHAIQHYRKRILSSHDDGSSLNNLAVLYKDMDLPIKSINTFRRAAEYEKIYPLANIAERFATAGFIDEARSEIMKIPENSRGEARPAEISSYINSLVGSEEERLKNIDDSIELINTATKWALTAPEKHLGIKPRLGIWIGEDKSRVEISAEQITFCSDGSSRKYSAANTINTYMTEINLESQADGLSLLSSYNSKQSLVFFLAGQDKMRIIRFDDEFKGMCIEYKRVSEDGSS